ncbi:MAG: ABC transporter permease, partial [Anaerolineae bacterium]|nr:ABC transporter permease [Anaerolineae bacterium]
MNDTDTLHHLDEREKRLLARHDTPFRRSLRRFMRHRMAVVGAIVLLTLGLAAIAAPLISPHDPVEVDVTAIKKPPSAAHPLGTDYAGRDVLSRLIWGGRVSLSVGLVAAGIAVSIGTVLGLISGFSGRWVDFWLQRLTDVVMTIPTFIIIITLVAVLGPSIFNIMFVIGIFGWTGTCRLVRGETLSVRERDFVLASRCVGASPLRIMFRHILPNVVAPIIVAGTFMIAGAILSEAGLSFLGLGVRMPTPTWGNMLTNAQSITVLESMPWLWLPPGLLITAVVLSINFLG